AVLAKSGSVSRCGGGLVALAEHTARPGQDDERDDKGDRLDRANDPHDGELRVEVAPVVNPSLQGDQHGGQRRERASLDDLSQWVEVLGQCCNLLGSSPSRTSRKMQRLLPGT